ncbi:MAG: polysaccharide biosynthesis protein [Desulfuromonadales bacterium]|nr:polysaccharide biosynthesis protein [Desulfuromonadales bacterium]
MSDSGKKAKKYLIVNVMTNILAVMSNSLVALWMTPFLIRSLGLAVFGMVPLVSSIANYLSIFNLTVSGAVGRFVALHLDRNENEKGNIYFNSSIFGLIGIGLLVAIPAAAAIRFLPEIIQVPEGYEADFSILILLAIVASFVGAITSSFQVSTFVTHRFFVFNSAKIASRLLQVALILLLFHLFSPSLPMVGLSLLGMTAFLLGALIVISGKLLPQLTVHPRYFRWPAFREMGGMGSWIVIDQLGTLLYLNSDLIIINFFLGPEAVGRYAPILQLVMLMRVLAPAVSGVFAPVAIEYIARDELGKLAGHTQTAIKFMGLLLALPAGLLCGLAAPFLTLWLGPSFAELAPLLWLLLLPQVLFLAVNPLYNINRGMNKVRTPALVTVAGGVLNIILALFFIGILDLGLFGMALASVLSFALRSVCFLPLYTANCLGLSGTHFFRSMPISLIAVSFVAIATFWLQQFYPIINFAQMFLVSSAVGLLFGGGVYVLALNRGERELVLSLLGVKKKIVGVGA